MTTLTFQADNTEISEETPQQGQLLSAPSVMLENWGKMDQKIYKQIASICDQLTEQGKNPSVTAIRNLLGEKSSYTTINNAMYRWRYETLLKDRSQGSIQCGNFSVSKELILGLNQLVETMATKEKEQLAQQYHELFRQNQEYAEKIDDLQKQLADLHCQLHKRTEEFNNYKKSINTKMQETQKLLNSAFANINTNDY